MLSKQVAPIAASPGALRNPPRLQGSPELAAHVHLIDCAARMELRAAAHSSVLSAVKLYDRHGRYLFSWIINAHHLLFYIRKPALELAPQLAGGALRQLKGAKTNPAGEVTVRLERAADAEALVNWLFDPKTWGEEIRPARLTSGRASLAIMGR